MLRYVSESSYLSNENFYCSDIFACSKNRVFIRSGQGFMCGCVCHKKVQFFCFFIIEEQKGNQSGIGCEMHALMPSFDAPHC